MPFENFSIRLQRFKSFVLQSRQNQGSYIIKHVMFYISISLGFTLDVELVL